jgi:hypothetical protein
LSGGAEADQESEQQKPQPVDEAAEQQDTTSKDANHSPHQALD